MRQAGADELDRAGEIGRDLAVDLLVGQLLRRAERTVAGVADDNIDPPRVAERAVDGSPHRGGIADVEQVHPQRLAMASHQIVERSFTPDRRDNVIAAFKQMLGHDASEPGRCAGNQPGLHRYRSLMSLVI
nr:hypothetical protein [Sphingomonas bacterium]